MRRTVTAASVLLLAACEGIPGGTPVPKGPDRAPPPPVADLGCDAMVPIEAEDTAEGVARQRSWLAEHYPGFEVVNETQGQCGDVPVDRVVFIQGGVQHTVLFDTTSFFGRVDGDDLNELLDG